MHRYQPRVHLVRRLEGDNRPFVDLESEQFRTYVFPETVFTAVTAYQNQLVSGRRLERTTQHRANFVANFIVYHLFVDVNVNNVGNVVSSNFVLDYQAED